MHRFQPFKWDCNHPETVLLLIPRFYKTRVLTNKSKYKKEVEKTQPLFRVNQLKLVKHF